MHDINITKLEITKLLKNLAPSKATGTVMIFARFVKETADEVAVVLALTSQAFLHQANIPDEWQKIFFAPIFKGANKDFSKVENYRPISLTSIACKVLEHVIHSSIIFQLLADVQQML